jgi:hypothetical protein
MKYLWRGLTILETTKIAGVSYTAVQKNKKFHYNLNGQNKSSVNLIFDP